jgi:hypothetical protein
LRLLLIPAFSQDFLQSLSFDGYSSPGSLGHLLRDFEPTRGHD